MTSESPIGLFMHRSSTRRKACNSCVKTKRRCDLVLPSCMRCKQRNLVCVYLDEHGKTSPPKKTSSESKSATTESTSSSSDTLAPTTNYVERLIVFNGVCLSLKFVYPATLSKQQISYISAHFKAYINEFVSDGQTPFIHRLYQNSMPSAYQAALSICSLYLQKTPQNQDMIFRMLDSEIAALLQESNPSSVEGNLLAVQALILYQIIRLFDGDVRQRANAERHLELLDLWTLRLQQNYSQAFSSPKGAYGHWVLIESIRRTTMVSVFLRCLWGAMKDGYCELVPLFATLSVSTQSNRFWKTLEDEEWHEAKSANEVFTYAEYTDEWNQGNVTGVGEYEKMLLVACRYAIVNGRF